MTDGTNGREIALGIILSAVKEEEFCHMALFAVLDKYQYLTKQERSFITRISMGTIEKMIELDYIIDLFSGVKTAKMKPVICNILRMGVYQLKYMDSVPPSAVCNEAVKLAEKKGFRNLKGFVNGVLRSISRNIGQIQYPDEAEHPLYAQSLRYSIPEWILQQWSRDYGMGKAVSIARACQQERKMAVRVNQTKTTRKELIKALKQKGITAEPVQLEEYPGFDCGVYLSGYDHLSGILEFQKGHFYVQDVSSMLAVYFASPKPGDYVIDACSAPGGKSLYAAEIVGDDGMVEARDLSDFKIEKIRENIKRCGITNIRIRKQDACQLEESSIGKADLVIADLPCSGLGAIRRKPDIRYRMSRGQEEELAALQKKILNTVCWYVKPGGVLFYSTCTLDRMENEDNARWFLKEHPEFSLRMERQIFPDEGDMDGFYMAKFGRSQEG